jgi:hypothetical protein
MKTIAISCNHCGAGLNPPDDARFITCSFCGTRLQVCHEGNAYFSRVMEAIAQDTAKMSGDLDVIKIQNEIERLDREWALEREKYVIRNQDGTTTGGRVEGGFAALVIMIIVMGALAMSVILFSGKMPILGIAPLVGMFFIVMQVYEAHQKGSLLEKAQARYNERRVLLLRKLPKDLSAK